MSSARSAMPGTVLALVILLYLGGIWTALYGLSQGGPYLVLQVVHGLLYIGLAAMAQLGRSWARTVLLLLCAISVIRALLVLTGDVYMGLWLLAAPAVYLILLNAHATRLWFHPVQQAIDEQ